MCVVCMPVCSWACACGQVDAPGKCECVHVCARMHARVCAHVHTSRPFPVIPWCPHAETPPPPSSYRGPALLSRQGSLRGDFPPALCMRLVRLPSELWACVDFLILWMRRGRVPRTQPAAWYRVQPHPARSPSKAFYHGPGGPQRQPASPITGHLGACMPGLHPLRTAWTWGTRQGRVAQEHHHTWWAPQPRPLHYRKPQWC